MRVGDKVKVKDNGTPLQGRVGVIERLGISFGSVYVAFPGVIRSWYFRVDELEVIEE